MNTGFLNVKQVPLPLPFFFSVDYSPFQEILWLYVDPDRSTSNFLPPVRGMVFKVGVLYFGMT